MTVKGTLFTDASTVQFNSISEATTFVNTTTLLAHIPAADFASPAPVPVTVTDNTIVSDPVNFVITSSCVDRVVTQTTGGTTCGEFRNALSTSTSISFALQLNDTVNLGSAALSWPVQAVTITGICANSGPGISLDVSSISNGFEMQAGAIINGLQIKSSGANSLPVLKIDAPGGNNKFTCSKITKV
jgi:hypothetical protein